MDSEVIDRLDRIEAALQALVRERTIKDWYSTAEVAALVGKAEYTVREWCRQGRVRASKRACPRGVHSEWMVAHPEVQRIRNEGLLPLNPLGRPASASGSGSDSGERPDAATT